MADPRIAEFTATVWRYYEEHGRSMPWRDDFSPYRILVSELMLQQTGVARVIPKFEAFMATFPTVGSLAEAPLAAVLTAWQGLGYNRRAKFLHDAAKLIVARFDGEFPRTSEGLTALPGIGKNTAGAIIAYAFDARSVFIETNIRTVLFHHFFAEDAVVSDGELLLLMEASLPDAHYREWYWALMDYGTHLKRTAGGRLRSSRHYVKQSPLKGSVREVRGVIIRILTKGAVSESDLRLRSEADERFEPALAGLIADGLVERANGRLGLTA